MSGIRWQFINRKVGVLINIYDVQSAESLKFVLQAFFPDYKDWEILRLQSDGEAPINVTQQPEEATTKVNAPVLPVSPGPMQSTGIGMPPLPQAQPPSVPPARATVPLTAVSSVAFAVEEIPEENLKERRRHERFNLKFRVIFTYHQSTFRTYTRDVSRGGLRLQQKLPAAFLNKVCKVFIGHPNRAENVELTCKVIIDDPTNPNRVSFVDCPRQVIETLDVWMLEQRKRIYKAA